MEDIAFDNKLVKAGFNKYEVLKGKPFSLQYYYNVSLQFDDKGEKIAIEEKLKKGNISSEKRSMGILPLDFSKL